MRIIKKYPNRRLYDTEKSAYITLSDVHALISGGDDFKVVDAESGDDITRSILIQIIIEQENGEKPIFTTDMLTKFIRFYDDASQQVFGDFLDKNLQLFIEQQKKFREQMEGIVETPVRLMQDITEKNLVIWQEMQKNFLDLATGGRKSTSKSADDKKKSK